MALQNKVYDKLGVGGYNTPVGMTVMTATTPGLPPEGDSARVMAVVDAVNASKYSGGVNQLQKALAKQVLFRIYPLFSKQSALFFFYILIGISSLSSKAIIPR